MGKALLIAAVAVMLVAQADEGVVTSTDLVAPDVSASERDGQARSVESPKAPAPQETAPIAQDRKTEDMKETPPAKESAASQERPEAPRKVNSEDARSHKAVAAFWFILPET
ncbi:MAG TPA: hypothetical protein PLJ71_10750 [Candidatus Hydrogenedentes bacterium]|nr:hypothetical protein [Candidatus Hydrogenedentota bacterium]